ncbi:MAG: DDE-type integrase/transposase/recombinase [Limnochordaceae bacterium]|nr:DDE-type integrase/transposase/recombinase [Limnochordaceae bacterium]
MAQRRVSVRKIREILRLHHVAKLGVRAIGRSCGLSHSTVAEVLRRAEAAGLSWPLPEEMDDAALEAALYGPTAPAQTRHPMPDMDHLYRELRSRKGVTLRLLWLEYKQAHPDGYQYSRFCELYRRWAKTLDVSLRQVYRGGEKMFVDFAGETIPVVDPQTGQVRPAYLFVAVLAASHYTFAKPTWAQDLPSWIGGHVDAFEFFGGAPEMVVCDYVPGNTIEEKGARHPADVLEGPVQTPRQRGHGERRDELHVDHPRPRQRQDEGVQPHPSPLDHEGSEVAPVHLGLLAGQSLDGLVLPDWVRPDRSHEPAHAAAGTRVALLADLLVEPFRRQLGPTGQPCRDILGVAVDLAGPLAVAGRLRGERGTLPVLGHAVPVDAEAFGHLNLLEPFVTQVPQLDHQLLSNQVCSLLRRIRPGGAPAEPIRGSGHFPYLAGCAAFSCRYA